MRMPPSRLQSNREEILANSTQLLTKCIRIKQHTAYDKMHLVQTVLPVITKIHLDDGCPDKGFQEFKPHQSVVQINLCVSKIRYVGLAKYTLRI